MSRAVNEFLGGGLDEAAMRAAIDASLYRNRRGVEAADRPA